MPPIRLPAAPLTGGVSTQPPPNRAPEQVETADNVTLTLWRGLEKRNGTVFVDAGTDTGALDLDGTLSGNHAVHWIKRDQDNRFVVLIDEGQSDAYIVQVFDIDGTAKTVNIDTTGGDPRDYIKAGSLTSKQNLRLLTVGDTTFIVNTEVVTALTGTAPSYSGLDTVTDLEIPYTGTTVVYRNLLTADVGFPIGVYKAIASNAADPGSGPLASYSDEAGPWWERVESPYDDSRIDATTMPVLLVYDPSSGEFTLKLASWNVRLSGDSTTNPGPSFIGDTLDALAIFQDRLWLGSRTIVSSQAGDLYNFWVDDWTTQVDSDPIDVPLGGAHRVKWFVQTDKKMVAFTDAGVQYEIAAPNSFTPSETNVAQTTRYRASEDTEPFLIGNQVYFPVDQGAFASIWEYFPDYDSGTSVGVNISNHVQGYLPSGVSRLTGSEDNGILFCFSPSEPNVIYTHFLYWNITQKVQTAWCRWVFDTHLTLRGMEVIDSNLYLLWDNGTEMWLEYAPIVVPDTDEDSEGSNPYVIHMDRKLSWDGTWNASSKTTTFALDFLDTEMDTVVLGGGWGTRKGQRVAATNSTVSGSTVLTVNGNYSDYPCWIGKSFQMSVELSPQFVRDQENKVVDGILKLQQLGIHYQDTGQFDVEISPKGRPSRTRRFFAAKIGTYTLGSPAVADKGLFNCQIMGDAQDTAITLKDSTPFPVYLVKLEFRGSFTQGVYNPAKR